MCKFTYFSTLSDGEQRPNSIIKKLSFFKTIIDFCKTKLTFLQKTTHCTLLTKQCQHVKVHWPTFSGVIDITDFTEVHWRHQTDPFRVDCVVDEAWCIGAVLLQVRQRQRMRVWYWDTRRLIGCRWTGWRTAAWQRQRPATDQITSEWWWWLCIILRLVFTACFSAPATFSIQSY